MSWKSWYDPNDDDSLSDFESAQLQAMHETVRQYEATQKQINDLLFWLATRIVPGEVDKQLSKNPFAFADMMPKKWRQFFEKSLRDVHFSHGLAPVHSDVNLKDENRQLRESLAAAEARVAELQVKLQDRKHLQNAVEVEQQTEKSQDEEPQADPDLVTPSASPKLIFPEKPPEKYKSIFFDQEEGRKRELILLAILASQGYSAEASLRWELAQHIEKINNPDSGSIKRLIARLETKNLIERIPISIGKSRILIVELTELGKNVAQAMGITPMESEWERLMRLHGGEQQQKHAAQVCLFAHYARKRRWTTHVCPEVEPPADPDVLIEKNGQRIYVEVEAGSGSQERRMKKWRNQRNLQGFVAICAPTESVRNTLIREARANSKKGIATDFMWLREHDSEDLWAKEW